MRISWLFLLIGTSSFPSCIGEEDPWSFIVLADPHIAETFASKDEGHPWYTNAFERHLKSVESLKNDYGGDLVLIPGDTNNGEWFHASFAKDKLGNAALTAAEAVAKAGHGCYGTLKKIFRKGGYDKVMVAIGDHEIGGNGWTGLKNTVLDDFRDVFQSELNRDENGLFLYDESIGNISSRPIGTPYEETSYAHQHKNVLFITVDCFYDTGYIFQDNAQGLGGEGTVTVTVEGTHLIWFESILQAARQESSIKHIIVQAHVPILQPVRKVNSSGQFFDHGGESKFWKLMEDYNVDAYLAGEVHATTVSKQENSNVLQVVSRGNQFNNFLSIQVTENTLTIHAFNSVGVNNHEYVEYGELVVDKTGSDTQIMAKGILKPVSVDSALVRFDFENITLLSEREVVGMRRKDEPIQSVIKMRDTECFQAMKNRGELGQQYDAQVANIELVHGRRGLLAAKFNGNESRFGIYSTGPHAGGTIPISYNVWVRTSAQNREMVLVHYGEVWGDLTNENRPEKDFHTLTLDDGNPKLYIDVDAYLIPRELLSLNDGEWHHISVSMKKKSCLLSDVEMYIDGKPVQTYTPQNDKHIFHVTGGKMSLGGFGYSSNYEDIFPNMEPYEGLMDEFILFGRPSANDLQWMIAPAYETKYATTCTSATSTARDTSAIGGQSCKKKCNTKAWCKGYQFSRATDKKECLLFDEIPTFGERLKRTRCGILL